MVQRCISSRLGVLDVQDKGGQVAYFCDQHSGLFVSNNRDDSLLELLKGMPHSLLLQNANEEFFILVGATVKVRPAKARHVCVRCVAHAARLKSNCTL